MSLSQGQLIASAVHCSRCHSHQVLSAMLLLQVLTTADVFGFMHEGVQQHLDHAFSNKEASDSPAAAGAAGSAAAPAAMQQQQQQAAQALPGASAGAAELAGDQTHAGSV